MNYKSEFLTTREAAARLRRRPQTLRRWSCDGNGPIRPVKLKRGKPTPLLWRRADIERLLQQEEKDGA